MALPDQCRRGAIGAGADLEALVQESGAGIEALLANDRRADPPSAPQR
ncbi:MAG: hypothetical protein IT495_08025 [Gammaproteobacteria bacterium]|nr:hypothetical protein [Gammaproteobacteria bacterium]